MYVAVFILGFGWEVFLNVMKARRFRAEAQSELARTAESGSCSGDCAADTFGPPFTHKCPDLHRNKGLARGCALALLCDDSFNGGAILPKKRAKRSGQEQRKRGSGSQRETGGFRKQTGDRMFQDDKENAHAIAEVTETRWSAGASSQA